MLAYELYYQNEKSGKEPGSGQPIKKIYVNGNNVKLDSTSISQYGFTKTPDNMRNYLQENFDMPIDTIPKVQLPKKIVASNSPKPYVKIFGYVKLFSKMIKKDGEKVKQLTGEITLGDKKSSQYARLSIPDLETEIESGDVDFKLNTTDYFIGEQSLYEAYAENKIIVQNKLPSALFEKIASTFFEFLKEKKVDFITGKTSFLLYILPNESQITHKLQSNAATGSSFIDSFNKKGQLPAKPTTGVFFISYDDPAFSINCKTKEGFYQNIGVSDTSLSKILLPETRVANIAGFKWYFIDLDDPDMIFKRRSNGIYDQLYWNYTQLDKKSLAKSKNYKAFCIKKSNAKLEVMIDDNLTMPRLDLMFKGVDQAKIPFNAYELLIVTRGKSTVYRYYIQAIKSLLSQIPFNRDQLNKIFTSQIRYEIRTWLTEKTDKNPNTFFERSEFCYKTLNSKYVGHKLLKDEEFAVNVGRMAREYVDFRKSTKNDNNSLKDLLSKPKYDFDTLKFVIKSIGRGMHLINVSNKQYEDLLDRITKLTPSQDVSNTNRNDLSYHFYMGYFKAKV